MSKFIVNVPEYVLANARQKMTAGQWLTEFAQGGGEQTRVFTFTHPVKIVADLGNGKRPMVEVFTQSPALFRRLFEITRADGVLLAVASTNWFLSFRDVYILNHALRTPAGRKGSLNIVRHYLANVQGYRVPLRGDFDALLSFLEIRPIFPVKKGGKLSPSALTSTSPINPGLYIMSNRRLDITTGIKGGKKPRRVHRAR